MFTQEELLNIGEGLHNKRQYKYASDIYSQIITKNPTCALAYFKRYFCYLNLGKHELAIADFNKAFELDPHDADILLIKIDITFYESDFDLLKDLVKYAAINRETHFLVKFAECFYEGGFYETSYNMIKGTNHDLEWRNLIALKQYAEAERIIDRELKIDPTDNNLIIGKGECKLYQQHYKEALSHFLDEEMEYGEKNAHYYHLVGLANFHLGKLSDAIDSFEDAIRHDASFLLAYKDIAMTHDKNGNSKKAIEYLKKAKELRYAEFYDDEVDRLIKQYE